MNKPLKAALLSAFVLPGSGHFFLKSNIRGVLLAGAALGCHYLLVSTMLGRAQEISLKIQAGEIPLNVTKITEAVLIQSANSDTHYLTIATYLLTICWLISIIDSYRLGLSEQVHLDQLRLHKIRVLDEDCG